MMSNSWQNLLSLKKSEFTIGTYIPEVERFMKHNHIKDPDLLLQGDSKEVTQRIINYLKYLDHEKHLKYRTRNKAYSAISAFYEMNNYPLPDKYLRNFVGRLEDDKADDSDDVAYLPEQVVAMHNATKSLQMRALILTLWSSGMRIGALAFEKIDQKADVLRVKDLHPYKEHKLFRLQVYRDSKTHRHWTFCSPQAAKALMNYFKERQLDGEVITGESYVFVRRRGKYEDGKYWTKPATQGQLYGELVKILVKLGYRKPLPAGHRRHPIQPDHSFKKATNTAMIRAGVLDAYRKLLLDHKLGDSEKPYAKALPEQILQDKRGYLRALPLLTLPL